MPRQNAPFFPTWTTIERTPATTLQEVRKEAFDYPFYNDGVSRCLLPGDRRSKLDLSVPLELKDPLEIKGFIFHTSHCGSTLLSRMISQLPGVRVVSESEAINSLLLAWLYYDLPEKEVALQLKLIIEHYRQPIDKEKYLVFKTTSWNIFLIEIFQKLYPDVPWIYIDRDTERAVESSLRDGYGFVQWWDFPTDLPRKFFLDGNDLPTDKRSYVTNIIERQRSHALNSRNGRCRFFQYPEFIGNFETTILAHFDMYFSDEELQEARAMTHYQSKSLIPRRFEKPLDR